MNIISRFEDKFIPVTESGCWIWTAAVDGCGYGSFHVNKKQIKAHRFSYMTYKGDIPSGLCVCHKCDTPACVNPDHLFIGTMADNMRDRDEKGRHWVPKGEDASNVKLTDEHVLNIREDMRTQQIIANDYDIDQSLVSLIKTRKRWRHLL